MIADGKASNYFQVLSLFALLKGIILKHKGDFYCFICFLSFITES